MNLKATDVFTPGAFPDYTYVERAEHQLEQALGDALNTPGQIVSLAGPSKSGKTVLVERVVGSENLITISGIGIRNPEDIWTKILNWMGVPHTTSVADSSQSEMGAAVTAGGKAGVLGVITGSVEGKGHVTATRASSTAATNNRGGSHRCSVKSQIVRTLFLSMIFTTCLVIFKRKQLKH